MSSLFKAKCTCGHNVFVQRIFAGPRAGAVTTRMCGEGRACGCADCHFGALTKIDEDVDLPSYFPLVEANR